MIKALLAYKKKSEKNKTKQEILLSQNKRNTPTKKSKEAKSLFACLVILYG